jgi:hypothetical protein
LAPSLSATAPTATGWLVPAARRTGHMRPSEFGCEPLVLLVGVGPILEMPSSGVSKEMPEIG